MDRKDTQEIAMYRNWVQACEAAGIPALSRDTSAKIFAVVYVFGNNEALTFNSKFLVDMAYIQNRFRVKGGETPDADFVAMVTQYIKDLEDYEHQHRDDPTTGCLYADHVAPWAVNLFQERYGIKVKS